MLLGNDSGAADQISSKYVAHQGAVVIANPA
jgi:hypothetical protein